MRSDLVADLTLNLHHFLVQISLQFDPQSDGTPIQSMEFSLIKAAIQILTRNVDVICFCTGTVTMATVLT